MHYYTHNIGEFAAQTRFMTPEEIGVFVILKDEYFANGMRVACDRIANLMPPECDASLRKVLKRFFVEKDGFYVCEAFEQELAAFKEKGATNSENAKKRWAKRRTASESREVACELDAKLCESHKVACETMPNQEQITKNQEPNKSATRKRAVERPAEVDPQVWEDWLRARKAPLTQTAWEGVVREAEKAGISLEEAIRFCAEAGWRGFRADWYQNRTSTMSSSARKTAKSSDPDFDSIDYSVGINPDGSF